jgi:hypothetical protein
MKDRDARGGGSVDTDEEHQDKIADLEKGHPGIMVEDADDQSKLFMSDFKCHMGSDMKSVQSAFPEIPDGVTVRTDNNTGRILSYSKPAPKLKTRA